MCRRTGRAAVLATVVVIALALRHTVAAQLAPPYQGDHVAELFAAIAQAAGMPDLQQTTLPPSYQEIRIADQFSMICCFPTPMLRLVAADDGPKQGEILLFRRLPIKGDPLPRADEKCVPLRDQQVRVRTWVKSIDWGSVSATLNRLGAWEIAEPCEYVKGSNSVSVVTDSGELYLQRLKGRVFSAYRCNAPRQRTAIDVGRKANAVYQYFLQVGGPAPTDR